MMGWQDLKVSDVKTGRHPKQWAIFDRQRLIHEHLDEHGMINPIVVDSEGNLQFGGCRLQYAVLREWDEIDAIVCDDPHEIEKLQNKQSLFEYTFLEEQYIERKQQGQ
jgi:ATP phosphoribosyltransferase